MVSGTEGARRSQLIKVLPGAVHTWEPELHGHNARRLYQVHTSERAPAGRQTSCCHAAQTENVKTLPTGQVT